jgi:hypothetical protein
MSVSFFLLLGLNSIFYGHAAKSETNTSDDLKYDPTPDAPSGAQPDLWYRWNALAVIVGSYGPWVTDWIVTHLWLAPLLYPRNRKTVIVSGLTKQFGLIPNLGFTGGVTTGQTRQRSFLSFVWVYLILVHTLVVFLDLQEVHVINKGFGAWIIFFTLFAVFTIAYSGYIVFKRVHSLRQSMAKGIRRLRRKGESDEPPTEVTSPGPGNEAVMVRFFFVILHTFIQVGVFYWYVDNVYDGNLKTSDVRDPLTKVNTAYWNMLGHHFLQWFIWTQKIWEFIHALDKPELHTDIAKDGSLLSGYISAAQNAVRGAASGAAAAVRGTANAVRNLATMGTAKTTKRQ